MTLNRRDMAGAKILRIFFDWGLARDHFADSDRVIPVDSGLPVVYGALGNEVMDEGS